VRRSHERGAAHRPRTEHWAGVRTGWVVAALCAGLLISSCVLVPSSVTERQPQTHRTLPDRMRNPPPHTNRRSALTTAPAPAAWPATETVGTSLEGRPIVLLRFGASQHRVLIGGGVHGNETGAAVASSFAHFLATHRSFVPSATEVDVIVRANPDGCAHHRRTNARGVDINRNFPSAWRHSTAAGGTSGSSPASEAETRALIEVLSRGYARIVSLHSSGGLIDFDGKGEALANRMASAAHVSVKRHSVRS